MTASTVAAGRHRRKLELPPPPTNAEKYSRTERATPLLLSTLVIGAVSVLAGQILLEAYHYIALPFVAFSLLYFTNQVLNLYVNFGGRSFDLVAHEALVAAWSPRRYPSVDVYLPICREPLALLANTWLAVEQMADAYPGAVRPYVLDDGNDPQAQELAEEFGFVYIMRPNRGEFNKAGNLRYAFKKTDGDVFLVLDADFAPRADFLTETMPYFEDPQVGIVQTPQFFRTSPDQTWVERGSGAMQEIFFRAIQVTRNQYGASMCVGSNVIYRRRSLDYVGGIAQVSYAEDVHTGLDAIRSGARLVFIPVVLAAGTCPDNVNAYARQQYRWSAGTLSVGFTRRLWDAPVSMRTKLAYFSGSIFNIVAAATVAVSPLVPLVMLTYSAATIRLSNWIVLLPAMFAGLVLYPLWHMNDYRLRDTIPLQLLRGWATALSIWDYSRGKIMGWQPTGSKVSPLRRLWWGVRVWNGGTTIAWLALAGVRIYQTGSARFFVLGVLGLVQAAVVLRLMLPGRNAS